MRASGHSIDPGALRKRVRAVPEVLELSHAMHSDPEVAFQEFRASRRFAELLEKRGFSVVRRPGDVGTAVVAEAGAGPFCVAVIAEFDALPGLGHGCGHNVITAAAVGTAIALRPDLDQLGLRLKVIGAPAEEHGAGKSLLLRGGVFDDVTAALMIHPAPMGVGYSALGATTTFAGRFRATFRGRESHAAAAPHLAVNATDAAVVAQVAIGLLRQQLRGDNRVAAFVKHGGEVTNVIPGLTIVEYECRAMEREDYSALVQRVEACFRAGALATGCHVDLEATEPLYEGMLQDELLCSAWADAVGQLGYDATPGNETVTGSTDMGNVSRRVPAIHPFVGVPGVDEPLHTAGFAAAMGSPEADIIIVDMAAAMAATIATIAASPEVRRTLTNRRESMVTE